MDSSTREVASVVAMHGMGGMGASILDSRWWVTEGRGDIFVVSSETYFELKHHKRGLPQMENDPTGVLKQYQGCRDLLTREPP